VHRYGKGVYFAKHTSTAHVYANKQLPVVCTMVIARCCVGQMIRNLVSHNTAHDLPPQLSGRPYESFVDNVNNPDIFALTLDNQSYPEFVVSYTV